MEPYIIKNFCFSKTIKRREEILMNKKGICNTGNMSKLYEEVLMFVRTDAAGGQRSEQDLAEDVLKRQEMLNHCDQRNPTQRLPTSGYGQH